MQRVEVIKNFSEDTLRDILFLQEKCFPDIKCHHTENYLRGFLKNPENINLLLKENEKAIGVLSVQPQRDAVMELMPHDPFIENDAFRYYVDIMLILPEYRREGFLMLLDKMLEEGHKKGVYRFSMHARISNGLSRTIQKLFKVTKARRIENWEYMGGETYDYIEAQYDSENISFLKPSDKLPYLEIALKKNQKEISLVRAK